MATGTFQLAQQVGSKGYFAKASVKVEELDNFNCEINISTTDTCLWTAGVLFGATYAWELFSRTRKGKLGLRVSVLSLEGYPADTTNLVVAYVIAFAVWNALDWQPTKSPIFDPKAGTFCFSKY